MLVNNQSFEDLNVPEEPTEEEEQKELKDEKESNQCLSGSSVLNFITAVRIARWMARAYGYVARKRKAYLSKTVVSLFYLIFS